MANRSFTTALEPPLSAGCPSGSANLDWHAFVRPIAHRGLHDPHQGRLENTAPAFLAAIAHGYGIECDLQAAEDGTPMVFHDDKLDRLVAASGPIATYSPSALSQLSFRDFDAKILSFGEFLDLVGGRVPLLVEVKGKGSAPDPVFLHKIAELAQAYRGPIALMSFNRAIVTALSRRAPTIPRGAVIGGRQMLVGLWRGRDRIHKAPGRRRPANIPGALAFYAVDVRLIAMARRWTTRRGLNLPLFTWTIRTPRQRAAAARWADAPIFEGYRP